jgi:hypothetical protein
MGRPAPFAWGLEGAMDYDDMMQVCRQQKLIHESKNIRTSLWHSGGGGL